MPRAKKDSTVHQDNETAEVTTIRVSKQDALMILAALLKGDESERTEDGETYRCQVKDGVIKVAKSIAISRLVTAREELRRAENRLAILANQLKAGHPVKAEFDEVESLCDGYRAVILGTEEEVVVSVDADEFPELVVE